jgi:hypothetical protein
VVRGLWTFALVTVAWVFFRADSTAAALGFLARMAAGGLPGPGGLTAMGLDRADLLAALAALLVLLLADLLTERGMDLRGRVLALPLPLRWAVYYLALFSILIFGIYGGSYDPTAFIYGQF